MFGLTLLCVFTFLTANYGITASILIAKHNYLEDLRFDYTNTGAWFESYQFCNGSNQSPIALSECENISLPALNFTGHFDERVEGFLLHNTGHSVEVQYGGLPPKISNGPLSEEYTLEQVHFHWGTADEGSEHQIYGNFSGMEAHLVHYKTQYGSFENALNFRDGLVVVAVMFEVSEVNNGNLTWIVSNLDLVREASSSTALPQHAMTWLQSCLAGEYFTYFGSLTSPPCDEVVIWIVFTKPQISVGRQQIFQFRKLKNHDGGLISENRRSLQPLNERSVFCSS